MARLGQQSTAKNTENGKLYFGTKDQAYLKEVSREAVEEHHNSPILYFETDWIHSRRNFYGEILTRKFKDPKGIQVRGIYKVEQQERSMQMGIPNKSMKLTVSLYTEQLKELGIEPKDGDYFAYGKRLYQIYDRTIDDVGVGQLMGDRERMRVDYLAFEDVDEALQKDIWGTNLGTQNQISNNPSGEIL